MPLLQAAELLQLYQQPPSYRKYRRRLQPAEKPSSPAGGSAKAWGPGQAAPTTELSKPIGAAQPARAVSAGPSRASKPAAGGPPRSAGPPKQLAPNARLDPGSVPAMVDRPELAAPMPSPPGWLSRGNWVSSPTDAQLTPAVHRRSATAGSLHSRYWGIQAPPKTGTAPSAALLPPGWATGLEAHRSRIDGNGIALPRLSLNPCPMASALSTCSGP